MRATAAGAPLVTHDVVNQPPPLAGRNLFVDDRALAEATEREGAAWALDALVEAGAFWGGEPQGWGEQANERPPTLRTHDRWGNRIDLVEHDESYHRLMAAGAARELHSGPWRVPRAGAHVARAAQFVLAGQAEAGFLCPTTMTFAAVPALRVEPRLAAEWEPLLTAPRYDPRPLPATRKGTATCGMAMTEKQGGSDVRANSTRARAIGAGGPGEEYELTGHKWFCSAPMSDLFLVLAQSEEGLSCFAMPRALPDGSRNAIRLQRLKDKLGNRSNASAEVEYHGAWARLVGEPGRGVATILEMVGHTRLDCALGATAALRAQVARATWHAAHRSAFGSRLADLPLMRNVLADLALEAEAATALALRLAGAYDRAADDESEAMLRRLVTPIAKYRICKRVPEHAYEAMEVLGGNGYVEDSGLPRLYREAPLNAIWEGSGNVIALDVLRALEREPAALDVLLGEVGLAAGGDARLDAFARSLRAELSDRSTPQALARRLVERLALALQGSLLVRHAPAAVADAFCAGRLAPDGPAGYGTLPAGADVEAILERHTPAG